MGEVYKQKCRYPWVPAFCLNIQSEEVPTSFQNPKHQKQLVLLNTNLCGKYKAKKQMAKE